MSIRALFICKKRIDSYGSSYGLVNSATFISSFLNDFGFESKVASAIDGNSIDKLVTEYNPTHVFIEALWVTPDKIKELLSIKRHKNKIWIIRLHSKIPFLANEGIAFDWIMKYRKLMRTYENLFISPNAKGFSQELQRLNVRSVYLPNIYYAPDYGFAKKTWKDYCLKLRGKRTLNIGCFGAIRPMKNHLTQAVAAIHFADDEKKILNFHINGNRLEQRGDQVLKNLRALFNGTKHNLIEHNWVAHKEFIKIIRKMDLGMQVSMSETFNIVAADFVTNNIPLVTSKAVEWMPKIFAADPNDSRHINYRLTFAHYSSLVGLHKWSKVKLAMYNKTSKKVWLIFLWDAIEELTKIS